MSKAKKSKAEAEIPTPPESDPHACLRLPAHPPKRNLLAFIISLGLFLAWLCYLVIVAYFG